MTIRIPGSGFCKAEKMEGQADRPAKQIKTDGEAEMKPAGAAAATNKLAATGHQTGQYNF